MEKIKVNLLVKGNVYFSGDITGKSIICGVKTADGSEIPADIVIEGDVHLKSIMANNDYSVAVTGDIICE